jgi:hypothetical protein
MATHRDIPECMFWPPPPPGTTYGVWQDGRCAGCGATDGDWLQRDHDHDTGLVRGLLCRRCNTVEGLGGGVKWQRWRSGWNPAALLGADEVYGDDRTTAGYTAVADDGLRDAVRLLPGV